jgi:hypothetical protein
VSDSAFTIVTPKQVGAKGLGGHSSDATVSTDRLRHSSGDAKSKSTPQGFVRLLREWASIWRQSPELSAFKAHLSVCPLRNMSGCVPERAIADVNSLS